MIMCHLFNTVHLSFQSPIKYASSLAVMKICSHTEHSLIILKHLAVEIQSE